MDLILEGPEDDSIGVETCCPKNSNIIIKIVMFDWYSVIYICMYVNTSGWLTLKKKNFHEIWYFSIFPKSVDKIQISLKSDKYNGHITWRPMYLYDHISLNSS